MIGTTGTMLVHPVNRVGVETAVEKVLDGLEKAADLRDAVIAWESIELEFETNVIDQRSIVSAESETVTTYTSLMARVQMFERGALS